ncbi:MAG: bifunctional acetaldehyde-CoA/alcohol dehydrogenase [Firmicutes bacterium]|nr:bifunctional acetaldehyde-CoA/alcohol dehydrogenase [Bacillota bacterium]
MAETKVLEKTDKSVKEIDKLVSNAELALKAYMQMTQEQVDKIVKAMTLSGVANHMSLAMHAVQETGRGIVEDKVIKNLFATEYIYHHIKKIKTVGVVEDNEQEGFVEIAEPVGIVAGVTPVTNPTSTTCFKSIISVKTRNPIIFAFHPSAQACSVEAAKILRDAAIKAGAPEYCIQWITQPSIEATSELMNHTGVSLILATGGPGLVKAAYSAGKPALGVGAGNVPCYINKNVDLGRACTDLMISKTFDNGMICASEQSVIVDEVISKDFEKYMKANNCYFLNADETKKLEEFLVDKIKGSINPKAVGQTAEWIAEQSGIKVPSKTKILLSKTPEPSTKYPLCFETLMPVLAYFVVKDDKQGFDYANRILDLGGLGHSAVIHSNDEELCVKYGQECKVGRVIVNSPSSQGAVGDLYNTNTPSLTLGCGSYGRNSTTANVSSINLINKKRIAKRRTNMQWFKIPPKMYFENGAIQYLEKMPNIKRAFIVTDPGILKLGYVDKALYYLRKRRDRVHAEIFSAVEPDPSVETIMNGVQMMKNFDPDVIIAIGGGSAIDAAKGMWLFYENEDTDFDGLKLKFLDIRKRSFAFPNLGKKAQFVAVPTTSGTGSEVTAFSVITDKKNGNIKYPLADYELTPDVAIIDPQFVSSLPKVIVGDTGMDVLTHAIEAFVSVLASDYTDGLAFKSIELVFENLLNSYEKGDSVSREKMHNASAIAGMAFTNAFLGINHSLAHKLGGEFHISHGRANAILLPYIIAYNGSKPDKFTIFPKYGEFIADKRYAQIAAKLFGATGTDVQKIQVLIKEIQKLMKSLNMPSSIKECGVDEKLFLAKVRTMAENAFEDQCTTANPRYPLITDIEEIYKNAYYGNPIQLN